MQSYGDRFIFSFNIAKDLSVSLDNTINFSADDSTLHANFSFSQLLSVAESQEVLHGITVLAKGFKYAMQPRRIPTEDMYGVESSIFIWITTLQRQYDKLCDIDCKEDSINTEKKLRNNNSTGR